jgi:hypothetical protein
LSGLGVHEVLFQGVGYNVPSLGNGNISVHVRNVERS